MNEFVTRLARVPGSVLALEFRAVPNAADFGFLSRDVGAAELICVDPLEHHVETPLTLIEQAHLLARRLSAPPLRLVITHCGTAALGLHVAVRTGAASLLLDPYPVTVQDMHRDFVRLCTSLGLDSATVGAADEKPDLARWEAALLTCRTSLADVQGGDDEAYEIVDDLLDRYRAWLRFLHASAKAEPVAPAGEVTVVTAKDLAPLGELLAGPARPRVHVVEEVSQTPNSPAVQALVSAAVDRHREASFRAAGLGR